MEFDLRNIKYKCILNIDRLKVSEGITAIIGKSGAGKSTLIKIMAAILPFDSGDYLIDGVNINQLNIIELRRQITLLSQKPVIYPGSIKDNIIMGLKFQNKEIPHEKEILQLINLFHLKCNLEDNANRLSLGEQQRICMIRVLLLKSKVYLLDEPTSSLDKETESIAMDNFFDIAKTLKSQVVFITHNRELAFRYAERVLKVEGGKANEYC